ncbi:hypothetical protein FQZ97_1033990 [compost metagenome]
MIGGIAWRQGRNFALQRQVDDIRVVHEHLGDRGEVELAVLHEKAHAFELVPAGQCRQHLVHRRQGAGHGEVLIPVERLDRGRLERKLDVRISKAAIQESECGERAGRVGQHRLHQRARGR